MHIRLLWAIFLAMVTVGSYSFGAGFALYEGSARGMAVGGLTGQADDPAAIFYNPAGITQLEGTHVMGGVALIAPFADLRTSSIYDPATTTEASYEDNVFTPPHVYLTHQLNENWWVGFGFYTRYGLGSEFDPDWDGRYSSTNADIATLNLNPNVAVKVNDHVSLAFGLNATWIHVVLEQAIDGLRFAGQQFNDPRTNEFDARQKIEGDNWGFGYNLAAHFKFNDKWSAGLTYNSKIEQHITGGTATFQRPTAQVPDTWFVDTFVDADPIDLPESIYFGLAYQINEKHSAGLGIIHTGWSSIKELVFNYNLPIVVVPGFNLALNQVSRELDWEDARRYNIGFEHQIKENLKLMWGIIYDESPVPDETISYLLPANDRQLLNFGIATHLGAWLFEGTYSYLRIDDRDFGPRQLEEGVLTTNVSSAGAHLLGFSLSRKF